MSTLRITTAHAEPGMVVAEDIYSFSDQLIIGTGATLTDKIITRLKFYSISDFLVQDPTKAPGEENEPSPQVSDSDYLSGSTYISKEKYSPEFKRFSKAFTKSLVSCKSHLNSVLKNQGHLNSDDLIRDVSSLFTACRNPGELFNMLMCIRDIDDATYVHSMNVSLICCLFGQWLKLSPDEYNNLILAGLLHDIGKMLVPKVVLTKTDKLTDEELTAVKAHSLYGYNILKNLPLDPKVKFAALMHHERCDGTGYPLGLKADQIDSYAKIVAIADVYDAMTAARVYRGPVCPFEVLGVFESEGLQKYDPKYLLTFLEGVAHTYLHHTIQLSTGEKAEIIMINRGALSRPVVRTESNQFIDLSKQPEISILGIL